jgi:hypothetical protein
MTSWRFQIGENRKKQETGKGRRFWIRGLDSEGELYESGEVYSVDGMRWEE